MLKRLFPAVSALVLALFALQAHGYTPAAQLVVGNVYAIIGPLGQRSAENDGLNNNLGFIVTDEGVILIDSGASRLGAERIAQAVTAVTPKPIKWVVNSGSQDHRWLGNDYFAQQGAAIIALARTARTQAQYAAQIELRGHRPAYSEQVIPLPQLVVVEHVCLQSWRLTAICAPFSWCVIMMTRHSSINRRDGQSA